MIWLFELFRDLKFPLRGEGEVEGAYVQAGVIPVTHIDDATHIAVASVNRLDAVVSWNYQHMVKLKTKREVNAINLLRGYPLLEIVDPSML